ALEPDGRSVLAGEADDGTGRTVFAVACFLSGGVPDASFEPNGLFTYDCDTGSVGNGATGVAVQSTGRIVVAGYVDYGNGEADFALLRLFPDLFSHDALQSSLDSQPAADPNTGNPTVTLETTTQSQGDAFLTLFQDPGTPNFTPLTPPAGATTPTDIVLTVDPGINLNEAALVIPQGIRVQINGGTWYGGSPALTLSAG